MVLRRKVGETIRINDDIRITIQEIQDGRMVRFGIEAPEEIAVHRMEVFQLISAENRAATAGDTLGWLQQEKQIKSGTIAHAE